MTKIAPSILAADFARLGEQVVATVQGGADRIHIDVMDGHFVPNLSMGPVVVQALRPITTRPLEVHLMITDPVKYTPSFLKLGADTIIAHLEVLPDPRPWIASIRAAGRMVGLAVNPETPVDRFEPFLQEIDLALCMTVHPGFGGQAFLSESPGRIRRLREMIDRLHPGCDLEVDGGVDQKTARVCVESGANVLVAGSAIFGHVEGPETGTRTLFAPQQLASS
jgi:ribulose-phosphate 3-epimerase